VRALSRHDVGGAADAIATPPMTRPHPPRRIEARDKVTGAARYAADLLAADFDGVLDYAVAVTSTQATGRITAIDTTSALARPGVRTVVTHDNAPRLRKFTALAGIEIGTFPPLQDDKLRYNGQCVALVVAETLEEARYAASLVTVSYSAPETAVFALDDAGARFKDARRTGTTTPGKTSRGDADATYAAARHRVDMTFDTAAHHHNAMEPGAAVAAWGPDGSLTVHLPTQFLYGEALVLGQAFGFGPADRIPGIVAQLVAGVERHGKVRVVATLAGGAFGSKNGNAHLLLAPMAAKVNGRPVKLVLTREQCFSMMPFRGETRQRLRLAAGEDGHLTSLIHESWAARGTAGSFIEPLGECSTKVYATDAARMNQQSARLNRNAPGWMRAPGVAAAQFALESAMDELAHTIGLDPLELRLRNHADTDPDTGHEWSSKSLTACYEAAAAAIGWEARPPSQSRGSDGRLVGYGMATSIYPASQMPAAARVRLDSDGSAVVRTAASEIGQGSLTAISQIAAESLGLELADVHLEWGDRQLPFGAPSVGSMGTLSAGAAVAKAARRVQRALVADVVRDRASPLFGRRARDIRVVAGRLECGDAVETIADAMRRRPGRLIERRAITGRDMGRSRLGRAAFGAQFATVSIDPSTFQVRVERLVGAFACGRIINPLIVRSQLVGGMIWGLGQALLEESHPDLRTGRWTNANLAEALVPTHADTPDVEIILIDEDDTRGHRLGVKGAGEIGVVGTAGAIANAIFDATGVRLTRLPMRLDRLVEARDAQQVVGDES